MVRPRGCVWALFAVLLNGTVLADVVRLTNGGVLKGKILEDLPAGVRIKTVGGTLFVAREGITDVSYQQAPEDIYAKAKRLYRDTASDQFKLAQWCARHRLRRQQRVHLLRVIALDANHAVARRMLGYVRQGDTWVPRRTEKRRSGYVRYKGRWMLPMEKDLLEREDRAKTEARQWYQKCRTIAALLVHRDSRRRQQGQTQLDAIRDPTAIKPMFDMLTRKGVPVRLGLVEALGRFLESDARLSLVRLALADRSQRVRTAAVAELGRHKDPMVLTWLMRALKPKHRTVMFRAVQALEQIGDLSVVPALIDVLVTRHIRHVVERTGGIGLGTVTPIVIGFDSQVERGAAVVTPRVGYIAPNQIGIGADATRVVVVKRENRRVLDALVHLTGKNFAFDRASWRRWYKTVKARVDRATIREALTGDAPTTGPSR